MTAAANLIIGYNCQITSNQVFDHRADFGPFIIVINLNSRLFKAHERPHTDTPDHDGPNLMPAEKIYRHHTTTLDMLNIFNR